MKKLTNFKFKSVTCKLLSAIFLSVCIIFSICVYHSFAQVPCKINYQGRLIKDNVPVNIPVNEQTLSIYWLDEKHNLWVKVPGTKVDRKNKIAKAQVTGFGVYTLMGGSFYDLSEAYAYPVPYKPNDGNDLTGTEEEGITFTGLSSEAEIKIYTITGELVKKVPYNSRGLMEWCPVENEKGEKVVSGVYIYYIKNDKQHKSGKLMIIR